MGNCGDTPGVQTSDEFSEDNAGFGEPLPRLLVFERRSSRARSSPKQTVLHDDRPAQRVLFPELQLKP